jgi:hypothetical protein
MKSKPPPRSHFEYSKTLTPRNQLYCHTRSLRGVFSDLVPLAQNILITLTYSLPRVGLPYVIPLLETLPLEIFRIFRTTLQILSSIAQRLHVTCTHEKS